MRTSPMDKPACSLCAAHGWGPDTITLPSGAVVCLTHDFAGPASSSLLPERVRRAING